jgi:hypothetical protein
MMGMIDGKTSVDWAGQLVTVGAQLIMVTCWVEYSVKVV